MLDGEPVFNDTCGILNEHGRKIAEQQCPIFAGHSLIEFPCSLWKRIAELGQTPDEEYFLRYYLSLVKGRNFPMLIPQARIGPAERRRPDFVLFAPLQKLSYRRYAIELDGGHIADAPNDQQRNHDLIMSKYVVLSVRPDEQGYFKAVKNLIEQVDSDMKEANNLDHEEAVAIKRQVHSYELAGSESKTQRP